MNPPINNESNNSWLPSESLKSEENKFSRLILDLPPRVVLSLFAYSIICFVTLLFCLFVDDELESVTRIVIEIDPFRGLLPSIVSRYIIIYIFARNKCICTFTHTHIHTHTRARARARTQLSKYMSAKLALHSYSFCSMIYSATIFIFI